MFTFPASSIDTTSSSLNNASSHRVNGVVNYLNRSSFFDQQVSAGKCDKVDKLRALWREVNSYVNDGAAVAQLTADNNCCAGQFYESPIARPTPLHRRTNIGSLVSNSDNDLTEVPGDEENINEEDIMTLRGKKTPSNGIVDRPQSYIDMQGGNKNVGKEPQDLLLTFRAVERATD